MRRGLDTVLGRAIAGAQADGQAEMLNAAGQHLFRICDAEHLAEMQCSFIADELTDDGWKLIRSIAQFDPKRKDVP